MTFDLEVNQFIASSSEKPIEPEAYYCRGGPWHGQRITSTLMGSTLGLSINGRKGRYYREVYIFVWVPSV